MEVPSSLPICWCFSLLLVFLTSCSTPSDRQIKGGGPRTINSRNFVDDAHLEDEIPGTLVDDSVDSVSSIEDTDDSNDPDEDSLVPESAVDMGNEGGVAGRDLELDAGDDMKPEIAEDEDLSKPKNDNVPMPIDMGVDMNEDMDLPKKKTCLSGVGAKKVFKHRFTAKQADPKQTFKVAPGSFQQAYLNLSKPDQIEKSCGLVVYLPGAGKPKKGRECFGDANSLAILGSQGHHVLIPCYYSYYGISNCKNNVGGCRLEAIEGIDHASQITVSKQDGLEMRIVSALRYLQEKNPQGQWTQFIDGKGAGAKPAWKEITIAGSSHGASSAALIAKLKKVRRAVMLSGPLDTDQAWTKKQGSKTPLGDQFSITCTKDGQHKGHLQTLSVLGLELPAFKYSGQTFKELSAKKPHHVIVDGACTHGNTGPREKFLKTADGKLLYADLWRYLLFGP